MLEATANIVHITLSIHDDVNAKLASSIGEVGRNGILVVSFSNSSTGGDQPDIAFLDRLLSSARRYEFEHLTEPYTGFGSLRFKYNGAALPKGVTVARSCDHRLAVRRLFKEVFGQVMSEQFWRWKYDFGQEAYTPILLENGEPVAHYGIIPRRLMFMGNAYTGLQACDVMVKKGSRGGIVNSHFALLFSYVLKQFDLTTNFITEETPVCFFGFPHGRHMVLGERIKEYRNLGNLYEILITPQSWQASNHRVNLSVVELTSRRELKSVWTQVWTSMLSTSYEVVIGKRDWGYGHRRYMCHPEFDYQYYVVRTNNESVALCVLRKFSETHYKLIDFIGPIDVMPMYIASLYDHLRKKSTEVQLNFWQLERYANAFAKYSSISRTSAAFSARFEGNAEFLEREQWWIMMGDTDFL